VRLKIYWLNPHACEDIRQWGSGRQYDYEVRSSLIELVPYERDPGELPAPSTVCEDMARRCYL
jgi:hypothetical protein